MPHISVFATAGSGTASIELGVIFYTLVKGTKIYIYVYSWTHVCYSDHSFPPQMLPMCFEIPKYVISLRFYSMKFS